MEYVRSLIRTVPDYPKPGIQFYDITPVLGDAKAFSTLVDALAEPYRNSNITKVAGIEARGFMLAAPVAEKLGAGFIPIRKPGKLPYQTHRAQYDLEYGSDALEVHADAAGPSDRVLLVDDVIATGGTAAAAIGLLRGLGAELEALLVFIELAFLNGTDTLDEVPFHALIRFA